MRGFIFVSVFLFSLLGCGDEEIVPKPDNLLPEETYVSLLVELQLLDAWIFTSEAITTTDSIKTALFNHYNTTEDIFDASNAYYQSRPEEHVARIDSALKILEMEQQLNQSSPEESSFD